MKILILGAAGMLGNTIFRYFASKTDSQVTGTFRNIDSLCYFPVQYHSRLLAKIDILDQNILISTFEQTRPELVINCIGLIKQRHEANDPLLAFPINATLPHRLDSLCLHFGARLVHFSTDCVFDGKKGPYSEDDEPNPISYYGLSKWESEKRVSKSSSAHSLHLPKSESVHFSG